MKNILWLLILLALPAIAEAALPLINAKAPDFTLQDQQGVLFSLREAGGRPLVLIASDREGSQQNAAWRTAITDRYGGRVLILGKY